MQLIKKILKNNFLKMGSISNSSSLRQKISLRSPHKIYVFHPFSFKVDLLIYSANKIYSRFVTNRQLSRKYQKNLDGFNFSFSNSACFYFSLRVFDKPRFFPGFFKTLVFRPRIIRYFSARSLFLVDKAFLRQSKKNRARFFRARGHGNKYRSYNNKTAFKSASDKKLLQNIIRNNKSLTKSNVNNNNNRFPKRDIVFKVASVSQDFKAPRKVRSFKTFKSLKFFFFKKKKYSSFKRIEWVFLRFIRLFWLSAKLLEFYKFSSKEMFIWFKRYSYLFKKFFFFIVLNSPVFFVRSKVSTRFFFFLKFVYRNLKRSYKIFFPYKFKKLVYNLSNFSAIKYKQFIRFNFWRTVFLGKLANAFTFLNVFSVFRFSVVTNNRVFVPDQFRTLINSSLRQKSRKKARGVVYGVYNRVIRFLFPRLRPSRNSIKKGKFRSRFVKPVFKNSRLCRHSISRSKFFSVGKYAPVQSLFFNDLFIFV